MLDGFEGLEMDLKGWVFEWGDPSGKIGKEFGKCRMDLRGWILGWGDPCGKRVREKGLEQAVVPCRVGDASGIPQDGGV